MNPYLALALLVVLAGTVFMLPLVPALVELRRKSDAMPLNVIQQHTGEIRHFAESFRSYIRELEPALRESANPVAAVTGTLPDGTNYLVFGNDDEALRLALKDRDENCSVLIAAGADLLLPRDITFSKDVYAVGRLVGGERNRYRAILGEKAVDLGQGSVVMRWVHAGGEFRADQGCKLYGRVSSDCAIHLQDDCTFQRLNGPRIGIGNPDASMLAMPANQDLPIAQDGPKRLLLDGDFELDPGTTFRGNLVVRGLLHIGSGAQVYGSVKGDKKVVLGAGVSVHGSLMSAREMHIGPNCTVHGPVIAERSMQIESGTRCGSADAPTTVSSPRLEVEQGVVVYGTLWAREHGQVVAKL